MNYRLRKKSRVQGQQKLQTKQFKQKGRSNSPQLDLNSNRFTILSRIVDNIFCCSLDNKNMLREVIMKIRFKKIDIQKEVIVEALLDSGVIELVISLEFTRKQEFKLKKIEHSIYVRKMNRIFNKEGLIEHIVEVNIYYQRHRKNKDKCNQGTKVECNFKNAVACSPQS